MTLASSAFLYDGRVFPEVFRIRWAYNEMREKMILLVRLFFMMFCLWLVIWTSATPALPAMVPCEAWNTKRFFPKAGVADVSHCLKAGAKVNARDKDGSTPLHGAAGHSTYLGVVTALLDAGADPAARDKSDKTPWDLIFANSPLKGTDVYWRLNDGRFR